MRTTSTQFATRCTALLGTTLASLAQAHEGHGLSGPHPHGDLLAPALALAAVAALGLWLMRGK